MAYSLDVLLSELRIEKLPKRWEEFFPTVMEDYDKNGCPLLDGEYYKGLNEKYGMLDGLVDLYCEAAEAIKKKDALARMLHILVYAQRDRAAIYNDIKDFKFPTAKEGEESLGYDMLGALAITALADHCYEKLKNAGVPQTFIDTAMKAPESPVRSYIKKHGKPEYSMFDWNQHSIDGKFFRLGRLQIHLFDKFCGYVSVFKNAKGEIISLADGIRLHRSGRALGALPFDDEEGSFFGEITEGQDYYEGFPYGEDGLVSPTPVRLLKAEWQKILCYDDYVIKLHIPSGSPLKDDEVEDSIKQAREFVKTYFPDFDYKAFSCYSWLCDPQVVNLLGEDANISKFAKRFQPLTVGSNGRSIFRFVFGDPNIEIDDIPENTRLCRALKEHYKAGGAIYDFRGFFF